MPSLLDSFFIEIGLDKRGFDQGSREAMQAFEKTKNEALSWGSAIEEQGKKLNSIFSTLKGGMVGLMGAFVGVEAARFVDSVGTMYAQTGRLSEVLGMLPQRMSIWQTAIQQFGGTAQEARQNITGLTNALLQPLLTGQAPPGPLAWLMQQAMPGVGVMGGVQLAEQGRTEELLMRLRSYVQTGLRSGTAPAVLYEQLLAAGFSQNMIQLLMASNEQFNRAMEIAKKLVPTPAEIAAAEDYQIAVGGLDAALMKLGATTLPWLAKVIDNVTDAMNRTLGVGGKKENFIGMGAGGGAAAGGALGFMFGGPVGALAGAIVGGGAGAWGASYLPSSNGGGTAPGTVTSPASGGGLPAFLAGLSYLESDQGARTGGYNVFQFTEHEATRAMRAGLPDPRVGSYSQQSAVAAQFLAKFYPDALAAIQRGDTAAAVAMLNKEWVSLPGGNQPQRADRYARFYQMAGGGAPVGAAALARGGGAQNLSVRVDQINVTSSNANPRAVAGETADALYERGIQMLKAAMPANNALQ